MCPLIYKDFRLSTPSNSESRAKTELKLPVFGIEALLVLNHGALDSIILDVDLSRLPSPILIDSLPLILSRIAGGVENLQGPDPVQIRGGTGVQTYPRVPFRDCQGQFNSLIGLALEPVDAVIDLGGRFTLTGDTYIFKPLNTIECTIGPIKVTYDGYPLAQVEGSIDWVEGLGRAKGTLNAFNILVALAQLAVDKNSTMNGSATGKIQIPSWAPFLGSRYGGQTIASQGIYLDNSSIRAEVDVWLGTVTIRFTSDGDIDWGLNWRSIINFPFAEQTSDLRVAALGNNVFTEVMTSQTSINIAAPPRDLIIRLTWTEGDTNFDLNTPSGLVLTPISAADHYAQNVDIREAFYLITNPEAGEWQVIVYNTDTIGAYNIDVLARNMPPSLRLLSLQDDLIRPATVDIRWEDEDSDDNAIVSLYYDQDNLGFDGVQITGNILEDDETDQYLWDTTNIPSGTYYIYAKIDDGYNAPRFSYSQGRVTVERNAAPIPPTNLQATTGDGRIGLTWAQNREPTVFGYRVYYSDNMNQEVFDHSQAVGDVTQANLTGLSNGRSYRLAVTAYDGLGRESLPSDPQIVSLIRVTSNNIPVISTEPIRTVSEYQQYSYDVDAYDADSNQLTYHIIASPEGMNIETATGLMQWSPTRLHAGNNYVEILVDDGQGGVDTQRFYVFVETEHYPPATTVSTNPSANVQGWNNSVVAVTLSAIDNQDGTGVKEIHYQLNASPEVVIKESQTTLDISTQGINMLTYWSVDQAGNEESPHNREIKIDIRPPMLACPLDTEILAMELTGTPASHSGIQAFLTGATANDILDSTVTMTNNAPAFFPLGSTSVTFTATDDAGNQSACQARVTVTSPKANSNGTSSYFKEVGYNAYTTFDVKYQAGVTTPSGNLTFTSSRYRRKIVSTGIDSLSVSGKTAVFSGPCTMNGYTGYYFTATVGDNATPGSGADTFSITVTGPNGFTYTASGTINSGDYTVSQ